MVETYPSIAIVKISFKNSERQRHTKKTDYTTGILKKNLAIYCIYKAYLKHRNEENSQLKDLERISKASTNF